MALTIRLCWGLLCWFLFLFMQVGFFFLFFSIFFVLLACLSLSIKVKEELEIHSPKGSHKTMGKSNIIGWNTKGGGPHDFFGTRLVATAEVAAVVSPHCQTGWSSRARRWRGEMVAEFYDSARLCRPACACGLLIVATLPPPLGWNLHRIG